MSKIWDESQNSKMWFWILILKKYIPPQRSWSCSVQTSFWNEWKMSLRVRKKQLQCGASVRLSVPLWLSCLIICPRWPWGDTHTERGHSSIQQQLLSHPPPHTHTDTQRPQSHQLQNGPIVTDAINRNLRCSQQERLFSFFFRWHRKEI